MQEDYSQQESSIKSILNICSKKSPSKKNLVWKPIMKYYNESHTVKNLQRKIYRKNPTEKILK